MELRPRPQAPVHPGFGDWAPVTVTSREGSLCGPGGERQGCFNTAFAVRLTEGSPSSVETERWHFEFYLNGLVMMGSKVQRVLTKQESFVPPCSKSGEKREACVGETLAPAFGVREGFFGAIPPT